MEIREANLLENDDVTMSYYRLSRVGREGGRARASTRKKIIPTGNILFYGEFETINQFSELFV